MEYKNQRVNFVCRKNRCSKEQRMGTFGERETPRFKDSPYLGRDAVRCEPQMFYPFSASAIAEAREKTLPPPDGGKHRRQG